MYVPNFLDGFSRLVAALNVNLEVYGHGAYAAAPLIDP